MNHPIPASHVDLLTHSIRGVLTTMLPDGQPQSRLVVCEYDGECARAITRLTYEEARNLTTSPKATLLVVDPEDTARYIEIRGDGELVQTDELRTIVRIRANKITLDAIHK